MIKAKSRTVCKISKALTGGGKRTTNQGSYWWQLMSQMVPQLHLIAIPRKTHQEKQSMGNSTVTVKRKSDSENIILIYDDSDDNLSL